MIVTNLLGKVVETCVSPISSKNGTRSDNIHLGSQGRICNVFLFQGSPYYTVDINGALVDMAPWHFKLSDICDDD